MTSMLNVLCFAILALLSISFVAAAGNIVSAEIQTCSGWALNRLPEVARFVRGSDGAESYENVKVNFIPGMPPDALFMDAEGQIVDRIRLMNLNYEECHQLFTSRGFQKKVKTEL